MKEKNTIYGYIYVVTNTKNNKHYIGQTIQGFSKRYSYRGEGVERMYKQYLNDKKAGRNYNRHLFDAIRKYGFSAFVVEEEFCIAYSKEELDSLEEKYIILFDSIRNGYNHETGGSRGKPCEETRRKMSENGRGERNPFYGKTHSIETRQYLSKLKSKQYLGKDNPNYGKRWTDEQKARISKFNTGRPSPNKGRKMSEEFCRKNSECHKGIQAGCKHPRWGKHWDERHKKHQSEVMKDRYSGNKNPNAKRILCVTTNQEFDTLNDGAAFYNISPTGISMCISGKRKSAGHTQEGERLVWKLIDDK